jgi:hypothetical protein
MGTIPNGIKTDSGLVATITFQAKAPGTSYITLSDASRILLNDGLGSDAVVEASRGQYSVVTKPPAGVQVFSDTHPFESQWYNNNAPTLSWTKDPGVTGFSYVFDTKPTTVPDNTAMSSDTVMSYQNISDGVWYFHIKALKGGAWGSTTHFAVRIDTTPPAIFTPNIEYLSAAVIDRFLVSFVTTDALSGIDHYEVGVIDKSTPTN